MRNKQASEDDITINPSIPLDNHFIQLGESLWTVDDVAEYLKLQPETIRSMARRGELPAIKLGKVWRFNKIAIHEMLINWP
jgi:excisionase family DNA binding protein